MEVKGCHELIAFEVGMAQPTKWCEVPSCITSWWYNIKLHLWVNNSVNEWRFLFDILTGSLKYEAANFRHFDLSNTIIAQSTYWIFLQLQITFCIDNIFACLSNVLKRFFIKDEVRILQIYTRIRSCLIDTW